MPRKKSFVNPLTQPSETDLHLADSEAGPVEADEKPPKPPKFEETHDRMSIWLRSDLKQQFIELVAKKKTTKTALMDEAIEGLLRREDRKPYTRKRKHSRKG